MNDKDVETAVPEKVNSEDPKSSNYDNPSSKIWSVYVSEALVFDKALVESWKSDMEGILIFSGLFSASVTAFIIESYKNLKPDSGEATVALLGYISQQLAAGSNGSHMNAFSPPHSFSPTSSALRVNTFWFFSLACSLTCALAATLVEQWARNYIQAIEHRPAPHKQAHIRAFLFEGIKSFGMRTVVESIPTLLHAAVFLFLAGLVDFLFSINRTIACIFLAIAIICASMYIFITVLPTIRRHCPYKTPLSVVCWDIMQRIRLLHYTDADGTRKRIKGSMVEGREMLAMHNSYDRNLRAIRWTMNSLTENSELEPFVEGISELLISNEPPDETKMVRQLLIDQDSDLLARVVRLLTTCLEPSVLVDALRRKRAITCMKAIATLFQMLVNTDFPFYTVTLPIRSPLGNELACALIALQKDKTLMIASAADSVTKIVVDKLQVDITAIIEGTFKRWTHQATLGLLDALNNFDPIVPMFEIIPLSNFSMESSRDSKYVLSVLRTTYIPKHLMWDTHRALALTERHKRIIASLKATYMTSCYFQFDASCIAEFVSTAQALVTLRNDALQPIAHFASCTVARIACHIQCDIVHKICTPNAGYSIPDCHHILNTLEILDSLKDPVVKADLQQQLDMTYTSPEYQQAISRFLRDFFRPGDEPLPQDLLASLEQFQMCTTGGRRTSEFEWRLKVILSQGHTTILIAVLQSMATSFPPDEVLYLTQDILQLITRNLVACFASANAQKLLVELVRKVTDDLCSKLVCKISPQSSDEPTSPNPLSGVDPRSSNTPTRSEGGNFISKIICTLLNVLGTVGEPESILDAGTVVEAVISRCAAADHVQDSAINTLKKLKQTKPFEFCPFVVAS